VISAGATFTFHGLRKNACCYLLEQGVNDSEVGEILGMSAEMVRHYGKRARALMVARNAAARATGAKSLFYRGQIGNQPSQEMADFRRW
jgi:integrase